MAEPAPLSEEERLMNWQFIRTTIDFRRGVLARKEAINRMSFFSGLLPTICEEMLKQLGTVKIQELMDNRPRVIFPEGFRPKGRTRGKPPE